MTPVEHMTDEQFERYVLEVLQRELGADGLARFLRLNDVEIARHHGR